MNRIGLALYKNKLAYVFDRADRLCILEDIDGIIELKEEILIPVDFRIHEKAMILVDAKIDTLICGAISNCNNLFVTQNGITVEAWICGEISEVIEKIKKQSLFDLKMPGVEINSYKRRHRSECSKK